VVVFYVSGGPFVFGAVLMLVAIGIASTVHLLYNQQPSALDLQVHRLCLVLC